MREPKSLCLVRSPSQLSGKGKEKGKNGKRPERLKDHGVPQSAYLLSSAYLRVKNLTVGYTLPKQWTDVVKIASFRLYLSVENVWAFSPLLSDFGIDPEIVNSLEKNGTVYPFIRRYAVGVTLNL